MSEGSHQMFMEMVAGAAQFDYSDLANLTEEEVAALKRLVGWRDEDFYERPSDPAKRAAKLLFRMRNSALSAINWARRSSQASGQEVAPGPVTS